MDFLARMYKVRNEYIWECLMVAPKTEKLKSGRLAWFLTRMLRYDSHVTKKIMNMFMSGNAGRGDLRKRG